jgi:Trm5-related predicted tRNA methylase
MSNWTQQEIEKTINEVKTKASLDENFRSLCLSNINEAVKLVAGKEIPSEFKIEVLESNPEFDQTIILPPLASTELSDEELNRLSGGCKNQQQAPS